MIEFHSYDSETVKNFRPVLAKSIQSIPDWWKKLLKLVWTFKVRE